MDDLGVPCPACGSLEVVVGGRTSPTDRRESVEADGARGHVPLLHDCSCRGCRHAFRHDFAFTR